MGRALPMSSAASSVQPEGGSYVANKRPLNRCGSCGSTWQPRGADKSSRCPKCGSSDISTEQEARSNACASCCLVLFLLLVAGAVAGLLDNKQKDAPAAVDTRSSLAAVQVESAGPKSLRLRFQYRRGAEEIASPGDIRISLRPWSSAGPGAEIATVSTSVTTAQFSRNAAGLPEFSGIFDLSPSMEIPDASWWQLDVTFTPATGEPASSSQRLPRDALPVGAPSPGPGH